MKGIDAARRWPCIVLAVAALAGCDHSSVPLPQRKTAPTTEPGRRATLSAADRAFVAAAAGAGLYDVEGGRLAATKGVSPAVRAFGTMLATQQQVANTELQSLANSRGVA